MAKLGTFALFAASALFLGCAGASVLSPNRSQNWTREDQLLWYHGDQGSRLLPKSWLLALESTRDGKLFFTRERMESFGYLAPDGDDATGLPIGFSVNTGPDDALVRTRLRWFAGQRGREAWVGMNCAACHTGEVQFGAQRLRIDGGPGMGDFQTFIEELDGALAATLDERPRFERFARIVLGARDDAANRNLLRRALEQLVAWQAQVERMNKGESRYGLGRLDAFGHIFNKVALISEGDQRSFAAPADAPVSYPFIWNANQHDRVQWNGIAPNRGVDLPGGRFDLGALGRNTGEVIGVFADVQLRPYPGLGGYASSVAVGNLDAMELQLGRLHSPVWPATFGTPDKTLVARGAPLFRDRCASCHFDLKSDDTRSRVVAQMKPIWSGREAVGTDPWMACNAFSYRARTGLLKGVQKGYFGGDDRFGAIADVKDMLTATVAGTLAGQKRKIADTAARALFGLPRRITPSAGLVEPETAQRTPQQRLDLCRENADHPLLAYKARPLNGIWATAPYLHNGSVRSLYELLLPPTRRARSFPVGGRLLDAEHVGFLPEPGRPSSTFSVVDHNGREVPGNSNAGHDYGNSSLSDDDRRALVEYMKTL